jgi:ElaB/YqjD/DUF883 family membrane-anchored ribosome-binding protein
MSHDRGCPCGKERWEYDSCENRKCFERKDYMPVDLNENDDFGFTFTDSEEILSKATQAEDKVQGLRKMIMPLLENLMKNPEKDTIVWPDREKRIKQFIKKMDAYINS